VSATLIARSLAAGHGERALFSGLDLVVAPGNVIGLVGANGAGKSTLLALLAGLQRPEHGTVELSPRSASVGHLPQERDPLPDETLHGYLARRTGIGAAAEQMDGLAARLATERAGRIVLLRVIVIPLELPLDADLREQTEEANHLLDEARMIAAPYGVRIVERVVRARNAGRAIVDEAERRGTEILVLGAPRGRHRDIFGHTVDFVLKNAPCRVMVAAGTTVV